MTLQATILQIRSVDWDTEQASILLDVNGRAMGATLFYSADPDGEMPFKEGDQLEVEFKLLTIPEWVRPCTEPPGIYGPPIHGTVRYVGTVEESKGPGFMLNCSLLQVRVLSDQLTYPEPGQVIEVTDGELQAYLPDEIADDES